MATNDVNRLLEMIYRQIEDARSPALKPNLSMVERTEILDMLDEVREQLPVELKRAQELLAARDKFVDETKREAERILRQAELEAQSKVSETEIIYAAREKAHQIVADAEARSEQLCRVANEYAEDVLSRMEESVKAALSETQQSSANFRAASSAKMKEQREKLDASALSSRRAETAKTVKFREK
ncbi:MAG: hypothetical protein IKN53_06030 [Oscillibacter sp.]|nr:hypothetical protein [Oscillibacter sp.]